MVCSVSSVRALLSAVLGLFLQRSAVLGLFLQLKPLALRGAVDLLILLDWEM